MARGTRPVGAPFWGESLRLEHALNVAGNPIPDPYTFEPISWRGPYGDGIPNGCTLDPSNSIMVWADNLATSYLQAGDVAQCFWVVEVGSGSGTLHLHDTIDSTWELPLAPNDLGALPVTGVGTYVWPASAGIDVDAILDAGNQPAALIECTSGSVEVLQVKMRVWPPGGALGSLSGRVETGGTYLEPAVRFRSTIYQVSGGYTSEPGDYDDQAAWTAAWNNFHAAVSEPGPGAEMGVSYGSSNIDATIDITSNLVGPVGGDLSIDTHITAYVRGVFLEKGQPDLIHQVPEVGTESVDWIIIPTEVIDDPQRYVVFDEAATVEWENLHLTNPAGVLPDTFPPTVGIFTVGESERPGGFGSDTRTLPSEPTNAVTAQCWPGESPEVVPLTSVTNLGPHLRVTGRHEWMYGSAPEAPFGGGFSAFSGRSAGASAGESIVSLVDGSSVSPKYRVSYGGYSFWDPDAAPDDVETRPLGWQLSPNPNLNGGPDTVDVNFGSW